MYIFILLKAKYFMEQNTAQMKTLFVMHLEIFNKAMLRYIYIKQGLTQECIKYGIGVCKHSTSVHTQRINS